VVNESLFPMTKGLIPKGTLNANKPWPEINAIEAYEP